MPSLLVSCHKPVDFVSSNLWQANSVLCFLSKKLKPFPACVCICLRLFAPFCNICPYEVRTDFDTFWGVILLCPCQNCSRFNPKTTAALIEHGLLPLIWVYQQVSGLNKVFVHEASLITSCISSPCSFFVSGSNLKGEGLSTGRSGKSVFNPFPIFCWKFYEKDAENLFHHLTILTEEAGPLLRRKLRPCHTLFRFLKPGRVGEKNTQDRHPVGPRISWMQLSV